MAVMQVPVATWRPEFDAVMAGAPPSRAETALLAACQIGEMVVAGADLPPDTTDPARRVRAGLIRYLLLGGDAAHRPHPKGVWLAGAWIDGGLDFQSCETGLDLVLWSCLLPQQPVFRDARLHGLVLSGCRALQGVNLQGATIAANLFLRGFSCTGLVDLGGARITGQLACDGGRFDGAGGPALTCQAVTVGADVLLTDGFHATGEVNLTRATITGQLACNGGWFDGAGGRALTCQAVTVGADVFLTDGFHASGLVDFTRARITGNLMVQQAQLAGGIDLQQAQVGA
ncbi:MAG: hypothetical protein Q8O82_02530, partial [Pseudorhodobacter sp.]|nr:hypothetical protein [Pseudorhodobacter sp.]